MGIMGVEAKRGGFVDKTLYTPVFWLNLGAHFIQIGEYQASLDYCLRGIHLAPEKADGYLLCAKAYEQMEDFDQALKACDMGVDFGKTHDDTHLIKELEEAKTRITSDFEQSKYGTFSS
jgi:predicted Zn-dependent protease